MDEEVIAVKNDEARSEEHQARADVYRLLAATLASPPKDDLITILRNIDVAESDNDDSLNSAWVQLKQNAQQAEAQQLEDEYFNLFIGLGKGEISPYASWYLTGFLMEKPLAELRTELARLGFNRLENVSEPEDHAAALCEVMGVIIAECVLSFDKEKAFFNQYISPWMGRFFDDLAGAQSSSFYRSVGSLGKQFMEIEQRYFAMLV